MKKSILFTSIALLFLTACNNQIASSDSSTFNSSSNSTVDNTTNSITNTSNNNSSITNTSSTNTSSANESTMAINNTKKIRIYLNPSVQVKNMYYDKSCSEAEAMNIVANKIFTELKKDSRFVVYINNTMQSLSSSVKEINSLNIDYHLALHSNAGGGSGSESFYVGSSTFAKNVLDSFTCYHSFPNRGIKSGANLYELKNSNAKNKALIEFLFHDQQKEAKFIKDNYDLLAHSVVETFMKIANNGQ